MKTNIPYVKHTDFVILARTCLDNHAPLHLFQQKFKNIRPLKTGD